MIYFIAYTHFNHENIIKYCNRPFNNAQEMNEYIIRKWNSVVTENDIVYHLGDVGFGTTEQLKELIGKLNGIKILIRGNHDFKRGVNGWKEVGFSEVYKKKLILNNLVLTHEPIQDNEIVKNETMEALLQKSQEKLKRLRADKSPVPLDKVLGFY